MAGQEENHASIRLRVDQPASGAQAAVDEHGRITISGILHKRATMVDVSAGPVVASDFVLGPPPAGVAHWAASWTTSMRPPHLGASTLCARAVRDPHRSARILRSFTVVDLIPPSAVTGLAVSNITATGATVTWDAATDNYGLAGYEVSVDGGTPQRTVVGVRLYTITGLSPSTSHTVSVVAVDLAGNKSATPATASFTTAGAPPPPPRGDFTFDPQQGGATASWHPGPNDASYSTFLNGQPEESFSLRQYCQDASGHPANPCTAQDLISYPIFPLDQGTPYTLRVDALRADGTVARSLSGSFTTTTGPDVVPAATTALIASEGSRCAGMGGSFYVSPSERASVPIPAGARQLFEGCYTVADHSCFDRYLPASGNKVINCSDDVTRLLYAIAPAGRGPVISSINGVAGATVPAAVAPPPAPPAPVTVCLEDLPACTEVISQAAEAFALEAAQSEALIAVSFTVTSVAAIGIGFSLAVLLDLLQTPTELSPAGLLEYPVDFNTDFNTYKDWNLANSAFYNSLKVYAETVTSMKLIARQRGISVSLSTQEDADLRVTIDKACEQQSGTPGGGCGTGFAVYVPGAQTYFLQPMPDTGKHIVAAMGNGILPVPQRYQWFYPAYSFEGKLATAAGFSRKWYNTMAFRPYVMTTSCFNPNLLGIWPRICILSCGNTYFEHSSSGQ